MGQDLFWIVSRLSLFTLVAFLIERMFFFIVASPLIAILLLPVTYYRGSNYDIRSFGGLMGASRLILVEKNWLIEKEVGMSDGIMQPEVFYTSIRVKASTHKTTVLAKDAAGKEVKIILKNEARKLTPC